MNKRNFLRGMFGAAVAPAVTEAANHAAWDNMRLFAGGPVPQGVFAGYTSFANTVAIKDYIPSGHRCSTCFAPPGHHMTVTQEPDTVDVLVTDIGGAF